MSARLLTVEQAAALLGVSAKTVRRRIAARALPAFRDGAIVRIRPADLDRYVARRTMAAAEPRRTAASVAGSASEAPGGVRRLWDAPDPLRP